MNKAIKVTEAFIENKIYFIRSQKVMLDYDLAEMYDVPNKALKQAVGEI